MGYFTRSEFEGGQRKLRATDGASLAAALPRAASPTTDPASPAFRAFWDFAFSFCLTAPLQKVVDVATASAMAGIALPPGCPHAGPLAAYLADASGGGDAASPAAAAASRAHPGSAAAAAASTSALQVITKDAWQGLGRFVGAHPTPSAAGTGYDVDGAWPLLVDGYVEWLVAHPEQVAAAGGAGAGAGAGAKKKGGKAGGGEDGEVIVVGSQDSD